jgi:glycine oxidase
VRPKSLTVERTERGRKILVRPSARASPLTGTTGCLGCRTAPAFPQPASRVGAHDANDEVDNQPDDRNANREAKKKKRETDQSLENAEHEAEEKEPQHGQRADREYGAKHRDELQAVAVSITRESAAVFQPDVIVIGGGLIGLTCATAIAGQGLRVHVITADERGAASLASAGILAPSVGHPPGLARTLGITARDMYPEYVHELRSRTGVQVLLDRSGVLEVAFSADDASSLRSAAGASAEWIDARALQQLEPTLAHLPGAVLHPQDGAVDSAALLMAVRADAAQNDRIGIRDGRVIRLETRARSIRLKLANGERVEAPAAVLAAGAWVSLLEGLPRPLPVVPVRGQMLAVAGAHVRHVVMAPCGYVLSRGDRSLIGSTMERVGFDAGTTEAAAALLHACAQEVVPHLAAAPVLDHWAGLRPVTPDSLPLVGADPECEGLFYACGHSRNGVLLAPLTASVIAALIATGCRPFDVSAYDPARFGA